MPRLVLVTLGALIGVMFGAVPGESQGSGQVRAEIQKFCNARNGVYLENATIYSCRWDDGGGHAVTCIADRHCIQDQASGGARATTLTDSFAATANTPVRKAPAAGATERNALDRSEDTPFETGVTQPALDRSEDAPFYPTESVRPAR